MMPLRKHNVLMRSVVLGLAMLSLAIRSMNVAAADDVERVLEELTSARAPLKTLVVPFTQERRIGLLATAIKSEGELTLVRPDRLRWELKPPDAITYFLTPEGLAYKTPSGGASTGPAAAGRFGAVLVDLMTLLGGDLDKLRARYDFAVLDQKDGLTLVLKPKMDDIKKHLNSLKLTFLPDHKDVRTIVIEEKNGDRSVITFGKAARDVKVDDAKMRPPKG